MSKEKNVLKSIDVTLFIDTYNKWSDTYLIRTENDEYCWVPASFLDSIIDEDEEVDEEKYDHVHIVFGKR